MATLIRFEALKKKKCVGSCENVKMYRRVVRRVWPNSDPDLLKNQESQKLLLGLGLSKLGRGRAARLK